MKIIIKFIYIFFVYTILISCNSNDRSEIPIISVDVYQDEPLSLSEISEDIKAIELETTDESLIGGCGRVLVSDDYILFLDVTRFEYKIFLFDRSGKFLRQISRKGQGPGEYSVIQDITADFKNNRIYISTGNLMCYDFEGNFIHEVKHFNVEYLNFTSGKFTAINPIVVAGDVMDYKRNIVLYEINSNMQVIDSMILISFDTSNEYGMSINYSNYLTYTESNMYLCYSSPIISRKDDRINQITLYQFNNKTLIPDLRLQLNDGKSMRGISTLYMYRSSRYVFEQHGFKESGTFCYDLKTKKGNNMKKGYKDDVHTGEYVHIRPFDSDADKFYYLHTNMKDSDDEEPNPTLYIGTLKK